MAASAPNILFILTDDQRWDSLGCYGNKVVKTPNLDKFAAEGIRMDNFYVAAPLCCPSRANFLTGFYPHQLGLIDNRGDLPEGTRTVANYLNEAGYRTGFIGKAHLGGDPRKWGFQETPIYLPGAKSPHENPVLVVNGKFKSVEGLITSIFVDSAIDFVRANKEKKWFLWLAMTAPHQPLLPDNKNQYDLSTMVPPPGFPPGSKFIHEDWRRYYVTISMLDEQIGRLLQHLKEVGLDSNTIVIVVSDNGHMMGSFGVRDKRVWNEGSSRVPALAKWPNQIRAGTSSKSLLSSVDLLPTILQLIGARQPETVPGFSMLPALTGGNPLRTAAFSDLGWIMVRKDHWKFVQKGLRFKRLFSLKEDPFELKDLSRDPKYTDIIGQLEREIQQWRNNTPPVANVRIKDHTKPTPEEED